MIQELERRADSLFAGSMFTPGLEQTVVTYAWSAMRPPAGWEWKAERTEANGIFLYLSPLFRDGDGIPSGFRFAALVVTGFDGGNNPVKGDLWACRSCSAVIIPGDKDVHEGFHALVDSLLEEHNRVAET